MEATTLLTLILLAVVGARNIPTNVDESSVELQQIVGNIITSNTNAVPEVNESLGELQEIIGHTITSYANVIPGEEVFYKDQEEYPVSAGYAEPTSNKHINEEETPEDREHNLAAMDTEEAKTLESKPKEDKNQETTTAEFNPAEVTIEDKEAQGGFEDRDGFKGAYCPHNGTRRGNSCWPEDKN